MSHNDVRGTTDLKDKPRCAASRLGMSELGWLPASVASAPEVVVVENAASNDLLTPMFITQAFCLMFVDHATKFS